MNEETRETIVTWYFEPSDAASNLMIASLGDRVEECPDKRVRTADGRIKTVNVFRADESASSFIFSSKGFKRLSFVLYKQFDDGDIVEHQVFVAQKPDPFKESRANRRKTVRGRRGVVQKMPVTKATRGSVH